MESKNQNMKYRKHLIVFVIKMSIGCGFKVLLRYKRSITFVKNFSIRCFQIFCVKRIKGTKMPEQFLYVFQIYILSDKTWNSGNTLSNKDAQFFQSNILLLICMPVLSRYKNNNSFFMRIMSG